MVTSLSSLDVVTPHRISMSSTSYYHAGACYHDYCYTQDCHPLVFKSLTPSSAIVHRTPFQLLISRLQTAFGCSNDIMEYTRGKAESNEWTQASLMQSIRHCLEATDDHIMVELNEQLSRSSEGASDQGGAGDAAMYTTLRKADTQDATPSLAYRCDLCDAQGCNEVWKRMHIDFAHGGLQRYRNAFTVLRSYAGPYVPTAADKRATIQTARQCQEYATLKPATVLPTSIAAPLDELQSDLNAGATLLWTCIHEYIKEPGSDPQWCIMKPIIDYTRWKQPSVQRPREFVACVFCALQFWSEELLQCFITGPQCFMKSPELVAELLDVEHYAKAWPLIPHEELMASSVQLPYMNSIGDPTSKAVLMHSRRVSQEALRGEVAVWVCKCCHVALKPKKPTMPKFALANFLWLGRHLDLMRNANLGHQLLLALARVVSTKVYLSSKGKEESVRQQHTSWRQKFLQTAMQGTAIVFGNGDASEALAEFPPSSKQLQDAFVAVFTGPENPSREESRSIQGNSQEDAETRRKMAVTALRKEVQLHVEKSLLDRQAKHLMATNYVYNEHGRYRRDLVEEMPEGQHVPAALEATATFVRVDNAVENVWQAEGPASSTTGAVHEKESPEDIVGQFMSVLDEGIDEAMESSKLPILQTLLERMENQAGRILSNELCARTEEGDYEGHDDIGRHRLRRVCHDFHAACAKTNRADELKNLEWKIQSMETNRYVPPEPVEQTTADCPPGSVSDAATQHKAKLRVPTTSTPLSWWDPRYWPSARPNDFCYGDCVWGLESQEVPLSIPEWAWMLWRREELEYTIAGETEKFVANPINRFRTDWYVLHLVVSFWQRTETTKSTHTWLKTPGAFGYTKALADLSPEMLEESILNAQVKGQQPTVQSIVADKDAPTQLRQALQALHQSTSNVLGSNGHRRLLQKEGVAYTLAFSAPLLFTTVNPADTKQPMLLVVQGSGISIEEPLPGYREMTERLASDPAGQTFVFELLIRCFFICVLGIRPDCVGWKRGNADADRQEWCTDGVAHDAMASTIFGWIRAAFGPIESQGRGSLHPHILIWLVDISIDEAIRLLARDRESFRRSIRQWMLQVAESVAAVQETSVTELGRTWGLDPQNATCSPLPFGPKERKGSHADGGTEITTEDDMTRYQVSESEEPLYFNVPDTDADQYKEATRPLLPLRDTDGREVDEDTWTKHFNAAKQTTWSQSISSTAAGKRPRYCLQKGLLSSHHLSDAAIQELQDALPSEDFVREVCKDARGLVIGSAVHVCSPSCWKYHSSKLTQICRHGFYHVVTLTDYNGTMVKRRRAGKHLYGCIMVCRDTRYGMAGRMITFQTHPFECPTNYAAIVAMRCNIDVQDLRRVPPPKFWMLPEELDPEPRSTEEERHGQYPQRLPMFSLGTQDTWGWMQHLTTTSDAHIQPRKVCDWVAHFRSLLQEDSPNAATQHEADLQSNDVETEDILKACAAAAIDMFVDAHNAGYYINAYTTKVNPTMDNVMRQIMQGVRTLHAQRQVEPAPEAKTETTTSEITTNKRQESFRTALRMLNRLDTSMRRASWKSGCEMLFPIIFGHMSFQTHRCWCVFIRRATWLAAESWRRFYGQTAGSDNGTASTNLLFQLPHGKSVQLPEGWTTELQSPGQVAYFDASGTSYSAEDMIKIATALLQNKEKLPKRTVQQVLKQHLDKLNLREGTSEDQVDGATADPATTTQSGSKASYHGYDQLDDWHFRGSHPILVNMPLYEYSRWVYRVEFCLYGSANAQAPRTKPKHVDIPFHKDYVLGKTWIQRLSREPRVPRIEGMKFHSEANPEMHFMLKSLLLRPILLQSHDEANTDGGDSRTLRLLHAYQSFCTSTSTEEQWPACGGAGQGPFQRSYAQFYASMERLAIAIMEVFLSFHNGT